MPLLRKPVVVGERGTPALVNSETRPEPAGPLPTQMWSEASIAMGMGLLSPAPEYPAEVVMAAPVFENSKMRALEKSVSQTLPRLSIAMS